LPTKKHYKAFISYSREDEKYAKKLHTKLETYVIPQELYKKYPNIPKKLSPIFRDIEQLRAGDKLANKILEKLQNSENLIVICSPRSAKSEWVNKEIIDFKRMHGENRIFPIIIDGTPNSDDENECFPKALKYKVNKKGELTNQKSDILASNIIKSADGKDFAEVKLISGLLGVDNDDLWNFEEKRRRKKRLFWGSIWSVVFFLMMGLTAFSWVQMQKAEKELIQSNYNLGLSLLEKAEKKVKEKDIATAHLYTYMALKKLDKKIDNKNNIARARSIIASNPFYIPCAISLNAHQNSIITIDITSDNKILASASSWNGNIKFWDMETQKELFTLNDGNKTHIQSIDFSPNNKLLAIASQDNISLWDIEKKKKIYSFKGHTSTVNYVKFSPNGKKLVSGSLDNSIKVWDIKTKKEIATLIHDDVSIKSIIFLNNNMIISISSLNIELWDLNSKKLLQSISTGMDGFDNIDILRDKKLVALGGRLLKVIDLTNNKILFESERNIREMINTVKFSPNGKIVAYGSTDNTITLWNIKLRKKIAILKGHTDSVNDIRFSIDGLTLISASDDKTIKFWDLSNLEEINNKFQNKGGVNDIEFSKDGKLFASTSYWKNELYLWDLETLKIKAKFRGHHNKVKKILFSSNGKKIFSASDDGTIKIWDIKKQKEIATLVHQKNDINITTIKSLDDLNKMQQTWMTDIIFGRNNTLLSSGWNKLIKVWDLNNNKLEYTFPKYLTPITSIVYNSKLNEFIIAGINNYITILPMDKNIIEPILLKINHFTHTLKLSNNKKILASGMDGGSIILWDLKTKEKITTLDTKLSSSIDIAFTSNDKYLVTASDDGVIVIWDIKNNKEWTRISGYTDNSVNSVAFSPDNSKIYAGFGDGGINFWNMIQLKKLTNKYYQEENLKKLQQQLSVLIDNTQLIPKKYNKTTIFGWSKYHPYYWLSKASNGDKEAMYKIGIIYDIHNQYDKALFWYKRALDYGNNKANEKIKLLKERELIKQLEYLKNIFRKRVKKDVKLNSGIFYKKVEKIKLKEEK